MIRTTHSGGHDDKFIVNWPRFLVVITSMTKWKKYIGINGPSSAEYFYLAFFRINLIDTIYNNTF